MCMQSTSSFSVEVLGSYCFSGKDYLFSYKSFTVLWFLARNSVSSYCLQISPLLFFQGYNTSVDYKISYPCSSILYDVCAYMCSFVFMTYWGENQSTYFNHMKRHNSCDIVSCIAFLFPFSIDMKDQPETHQVKIFLPGFMVILVSFWSI